MKYIIDLTKTENNNTHIKETDSWIFAGTYKHIWLFENESEIPTSVCKIEGAIRNLLTKNKIGENDTITVFITEVSIPIMKMITEFEEKIAYLGYEMNVRYPDGTPQHYGAITSLKRNYEDCKKELDLSNKQWYEWDFSRETAERVGKYCDCLKIVHKVTENGNNIHYDVFCSEEDKEYIEDRIREAKLCQKFMAL